MVKVNYLISLSLTTHTHTTLYLHQQHEVSLPRPVAKVDIYFEKGVSFIVRINANGV